MRADKKHFVASILCVFYLFSAFAGEVHAKELQAGVSPIVLDLGTIEKGESRVGSFFIVTSSEDEILVRLGSLMGNFDFFRKPEYSDIVNYVSEEDSSKWVFFPSNPYVLKKKNESLKTVGGTVADWKRVSFALNVPKDAEPCYHAFQINPSPYLAEEYGNSVNIVAVTAITVKFMVGGLCSINGRILDIMQGTYYGETFEIDVYFQNTGTATVSAYAPSVALYYENGTKIDSRQSGYAYVGPGETEILKAQFDSKKVISGGRYIVNATVAYGANETSKNAEIVIESSKISRSAGMSASDSGMGTSGYYFWFVLVAILAAAYYVYRKDS